VTLGRPFYPLVTIGHEWSPGLSQNQANGGSIGEGLDFQAKRGVDAGRIVVATGVAGNMRRVIRAFAVAACAVALGGCATASRISYTPQEQSTAVIPGIPGARVWADDPGLATERPIGSGVALKQPTALALSGGGADGAFGAGLLAGWSTRGTRPQFTVVTGASAGALIAPFAFMGPAYDDMLKSVFASGEMANLLQSDGLAGLFGTGLFKTAPLRNLIARHVDAALLEAIAHEYRTGRRLYVVTTNLDAQRTAIWDMGKIAASGDPRALELFRNVLTASASIPGVFSPVLIDVEADGKRFAEMHVDGGVTTNVLIVPEAALLSGTPLFAPDARPKVYIVMNGKLAPDFEVVTPSTVLIAARSFETSVRANTRNALLASYQFAKRRNWEFNLASIDPDYPKSTSIGFDPTYMQQLFEYGYRRGRSGKLWQATPSDLSLPPPPRVAGR
jgi:predicted acylesterase/phospholipase RssA